MRSFLRRFTEWFRSGKSVTGPIGSSGVTEAMRHRNPTPQELLGELKTTAYTCATINASVCASYPPRLYVRLDPDYPRPRCLTRGLDAAVQRKLRDSMGWRRGMSIEEVVEHPLLTLLQRVNACHNAFDFLELTTLYQEVDGSAYWLLDINELGVPCEIWILPSQHVCPHRDPGSPNIVDYYEYTGSAATQRFPADRVIAFRYPDPRDPYNRGLSPLRAAWEPIGLLSEYASFKRARFENRALPDAVISPEIHALGQEERDRLETQWNSKFRHRGNGRVLVAEEGLRVQLLNQSIGDLAALAEMGKTKEDVANAFHVPLAFLTSETNLANLQAAEHQHMAKAIRPRLCRRDEKINEQLIPWFDPTGRLFVASDDPVPINQEMKLQQQDCDLRHGVVTINEVRQERGLPPVAWGNAPFMRDEG